MSQTISTQLNQLIEAVKSILKKDHVDPNVALLELGVDSMNVVELIMVCEQIYTNVVNPDSLEFDEYTTLQEIDEQMQMQAA